MGIFRDLTGMTFGRLRVLRRAQNSRSGKVQWEVQCSCPDKTIFVVPSLRLINGETKSCGCFRKEFLSETKTKDLTGMTFGRLKVIRRVENGAPIKNHPGGSVRYECECSCPNHTRVIVLTGSLLSGKTKSCGCFRKEKVSELKKKWTTQEEQDIASRFDDMKKRCYNANSEHYNEYGGRGIYICDEWLHDRSKFVSWAKDNGFKKELTIDRVDNDGPYAPWNCRFVDMQTQCNNRRSNNVVEIDGTRHTLTEWARLCGHNYSYMKYWLDKGYEMFKDIVLYNLSLKKDSNQ